MKINDNLYIGIINSITRKEIMKRFLLTGLILVVILMAGCKVSQDVSAPIETGFKEYKNSDIGIKSMIYPADWSFVVSEDRAVASFSSPDKIAGFDIGVYIYDESINLETFHSRLLKMFPEEPNVEFTILDEEIKEINNRKWLISNRIVKINNVSIWQKFGLILTGYYDNQQTIQIVMETDEEHFKEYKLLFDKIVKSIRFTI
ncbi:hypothetical protein HYU07_02855 [Candidatus Woesearchaeota archaeon]|nr:hypothetical protein [Candidatus Woesearchaeota archaeon]